MISRHWPLNKKFLHGYAHKLLLHHFKHAIFQVFLVLKGSTSLPCLNP